MMLLNLGSRGEEVTLWQAFLRGLNPYSCVIVNGTFDAQTQQETREFQDLVSVHKTGTVTLETLNAAINRGFNPTTKLRVSQFKREDVFGKFVYTPKPTSTNPEAIVVDNNWIKNNIVSVIVPQLKLVSNSPKNNVVRCHTRVAQNITELFAAWETANLLSLVLTWDGMWVPRFIRGSRTTLSNHAWGTAFDINARWNPLGRTPAPRETIGSVEDLVPLARQHGFLWGGEWGSRPDAMHFECVEPKS